MSEGWRGDTGESSCGVGGGNTRGSGSRTGWLISWAEVPGIRRQTDSRGHADDQETGK